MSQRPDGRSQSKPSPPFEVKAWQAEAHAARCANEALIDPDQLSCCDRAGQDTIRDLQEQLLKSEVILDEVTLRITVDAQITQRLRCKAHASRQGCHRVANEQTELRSGPVCDGIQQSWELGTLQLAMSWSDARD